MATSKPRIHATALIDPAATLADDVEVGAYTVIGPHVVIGAGTVIASHVVIEPSVTTQRSPALTTGTASDGTKQEGFVTFLVPSDTTLVLRYSSGGSTADFKVKPK